MSYPDLGILILLVAILAHYVSMPLINFFQRFTSQNQEKVQTSESVQSFSNPPTTHDP